MNTTLESNETATRPVNNSLQGVLFRQYIDVVDPHFIWTPWREIAVEKLQRVADGELKRLAIYAPPRAGKTRILKHFAAYYLRRHTEHHLGYCTYDSRFSAACIRDIENHGARKDQLLWPIGVGGPMTGFPMNVGIMDSLTKNTEAHRSQIQQEKAREWYTQTFLTHLQVNGAIVLMDSRWPFYRIKMDGEVSPEVKTDLADFIMLCDGDEWEVLNVEAIEGVREGFPDEERSYDPERYSLEKLRHLRSEVGDVLFNALYQQNPITLDKEGNLPVVEVEGTLPREPQPYYVG